MKSKSILKMLLVLCIFASEGCAQAAVSQPTTSPATRPATPAKLTAAKLLTLPDDWFSSAAGIEQIDRIISHQLPSGGWEKGYDITTARPASKLIPVDDVQSWHGEGTFDNGFTYTELRLLARAYVLTHRENVRESFNRGFDFIIKSQYANGGWPQRFPLQENYGKDITFNDNAMTSILFFLKDVVEKKPTFEWVDSDRRAKGAAAFENGIKCIVKCQVISNGRPTAWAQQYDPVTLQPAKARAYELPAITAGESCGIIKLLMSIENPSEDVQRAVHSAVRWLNESKITKKRLIRQTGELIDDPQAEPIWSRFYELETNRPFFCGRDGVKKYSLTEIEKERRTGYAWYRPWGKTVLENYPKWAEKYPDRSAK